VVAIETPLSIIHYHNNTRELQNSFRPFHIRMLTS